MRVVIPLLVLLFSMCEVQTESQSTGAAAAAVTTQLDVSTELRELRDMVVELRVLLTITQNELQKVKVENAAVKTEAMNLKMETATELTAVKTRLTAAEKNIREQPKVAFSAALTGSGTIVSGNTELNLVFTKIITNVGQAYSSTTGFFTAPVNGVYYFRFTVMDRLNYRSMRIMMYKNGERIMGLYEYDTDGYQTYLSSGATLQLEEGDVVNMRLPAGGYILSDDSNNYNIFSGFLLFPL